MGVMLETGGQRALEPLFDLERRLARRETGAIRDPEEVKALRQANALRVFLAGLVISGVVAVPFLNLITPVFATALMVHVHKRVAPTRKVTSPDELY